MERIVHTRCSPQISILKGGAVEKLEGFAVAALSPQFLSACQGINLRLTNEFMGMRVGDYGNYEKIYAYHHLGGGKFAFLCTAEREPEAVGNRSPRPVFLSEAIVGEFSSSPVRYLNDANFPAFLVSQADYYRMDKGQNEQPMPLNPVEENELQEGIPFELTYFRTPEKQKDLATLIAYFYEQLALPEEKRTILYMYGPNADILAYIRAIGVALPSQLAKRFTFLSHTSKINNNPERYGYSMIQPNGEIGEFNPFLENPTGKRSPKYMLIGESSSPSLPRNQRSQFNFFDATKLTGTVVANPGKFINDLAADEAAAREFLAYINNNLGGVLPAGIDSFYDTFRVLLRDGAEDPSYDELVASLRYFLDSNLAGNAAVRAQIAAKLPRFYEGMLEKDLGNNLVLLGLYEKFDHAIAASMDSLLENKYTAAIRNFEYGNELMPLRSALAACGKLEAIEAKIMPNEIKGEVFSRLISANAPKEKVTFYLNALKKKGPLSLSEKDVIMNSAKTMMVRYAESDLELLRALDALLVADPAQRALAYSKAINEIYPSGNEKAMDNLLTLCIGPKPFKEKELTLAKTLANGSYAFFEKRYTRDVALGDKREKAETLLALFEIYPIAEGSPDAGYLFLKAWLDRVPAQGGEEELKNVVAYFAKMKEHKGLLPNREIIAKIESLVASSLYGGNKNLPASADLTALGIEGPARLAALENALRMKVPAKQAEALAEFAKNPLAISSEDVCKPFMKGLIKSLVYLNNPIHLNFFEAFPCQNVAPFARNYFGVLSEDKKTLDGMALYFSLCLTLSEGKKKPGLAYQLTAFEDIMKVPDNDIIATCYDKKFEKAAASLPENTPELKEAKERLIKDFEGYKKAHQGFFSKLFHR